MSNKTSAHLEQKSTDNELVVFVNDMVSGYTNPYHAYFNTSISPWVKNILKMNSNGTAKSFKKYLPTKFDDTRKEEHKDNEKLLNIAASLQKTLNSKKDEFWMENEFFKLKNRDNIARTVNDLFVNFTSDDLDRNNVTSEFWKFVYEKVVELQAKK